VALGVLAAWVPAGAAAAPNYVALGDSYAAGPIIPQQIAPYGCLKSNNNYAHIAAKRQGIALRDATCSGAETEDMTQPQDVRPGPNPPQFDRLDADTTLVTLQIGGNDIGFSDIVENCSSLSPIGHPCQDHYVVNGDDQISDNIQATAPKVADVLQGIHALAPNARVFVVNYLTVLPQTGNGLGCWPQLPIAAGDVAYLRAKEEELNAMLATQAAASGDTVIDDYAYSRGHDACRPPLIRWVEPLIPASPAAPIHPNLLGMKAVARLVVQAAQN
jgi:lysophospholipase L1-like esterase